MVGKIVICNKIITLSPNNPVLGVEKKQKNKKIKLNQVMITLGHKIKKVTKIAK